MPCRLELYPIVRKISSFIYELDLLAGNRIYPVIFIIYLIRYYINDDPYNRILPFPDLIKYRLESDSILNDDKRNGKR